MNAIRQTALLNKRELENATEPSASWHADYRDTAYIYIGGIPLDLSEGDVVTIFSQYGNPTHLNLVRDRETGKSKGFAFLKYQDQRSCDLAVDNLGGAQVMGRMLRVDHTRYKKKEGEDEDTWRIDRLEAEANGKRASETEESEEERKRRKKRRPVLKEEKELEELLAIKQEGEEQDPMREYLIREKKEEVERAKEIDRKKRHKHRHRGEDGDEGRHSRRRNEAVEDGYPERKHRHRHREEDEESGRRNRRDSPTRHHRHRVEDENGRERTRHRSRSRSADRLTRHERLRESGSRQRREDDRERRDRSP